MPTIKDNAANMLFSTRYKYYLNYGTTSGTVSIPVTSYTAGTAKSYSITIPIDRTNDFTNVKINFSTDAGDWFSFPTADFVLDANFSIATTGAYSGSNLLLTFYLINQTGITHTNTAVVITAAVAKFVTPT